MRSVFSMVLSLNAVLKGKKAWDRSRRDNLVTLRTVSLSQSGKNAPIANWKTLGQLNCLHPLLSGGSGTLSGSLKHQIANSGRE